MGRVADWKRAIQDFKQFTSESEAEETQVNAKRTEAFVKEVTERIFPEAWVFKTGSQQHPDFLVTTQDVQSRVQSFATGPRGGKKKITKGLLLTWETRHGAPQGVRLLRLEVKSTTGDTFVLNDTFPNPNPDHDELYVMFAGADRNVYVTTSATMATVALDEPPSILERYARSNEVVEEFGRQLEHVWRNTPVGTAPRPTYSIDASYARREAGIDLLVGLFEAAGLKDLRSATGA